MPLLNNLPPSLPPGLKVLCYELGDGTVFNNHVNQHYDILERSLGENTVGSNREAHQVIIDTGFTQAQMTRIENALALLYSLAPTKALIDKAVSEKRIYTKDGSGNIKESDISIAFFNTTGKGSKALPADMFYYACLDFDEIDDFFFIGKNGEVIGRSDFSNQETMLALIIAHELSHSSYAKDDPITIPNTDIAPMNRANYDHIGGAQEFANEVIYALTDDHKFESSSYNSHISYANLVRYGLKKGVSYTENNAIKYTYMDIKNETPDYIDNSNSQGDYLILGLDARDEIIAGDGNDYIYGGNDPDQISGGGGNNVIHGGILDGNYLDDGIDIATYERAGSAITVELNKNAETIRKNTNSDAPEKGILVSNNGYGGQDRLFSIETIKGSNHDDTFKINNIDLSVYTLSNYEGGGTRLELLAGTGQDTLDFSGLDVGASVKYMAGRRYAIVTAQNGEIHAKDFEKFIGNEHSDKFEFEGCLFDLTFIASGGNDIYIGGNGQDTVIYSNATSAMDIASLSQNGGTGMRPTFTLQDGQGGTDILTGIETISLSHFDEVFNVTTAHCDLNVTVDMAEGKDTVNFSELGDGVTFENYRVSADGHSGLRITGAEIFIGSSFKDEITLADSTDDLYLEGGAGEDTLKTGSGNDILIGGADKDRLEGGSGNDSYYVGSGDTIKDSDGNGHVFIGSGPVDGAQGPGQPANRSQQVDVEPPDPNIKISNLFKIVNVPEIVKTLAGEGTDVYRQAKGDIYAWKKDGEGLKIYQKGFDDAITIEDWSEGNLGIYLKTYDPEKPLEKIFLEFEPLYDSMVVTVGAKMTLVKRTFMVDEKGNLREDNSKAKGIWVYENNLEDGLNVRIDEKYVLNQPGSHFLRPGAAIDITEIVEWERLKESAEVIKTNSEDRGDYHYWFDHPELGTAANKKPYPYVNWNSFALTLLNNEGIDVTNLPGLDWSTLIWLFGAGPLGAITQSSTLLATARLGENLYEVRAGDKWEHGLNLVGGDKTNEDFYGTKYTDFYFGSQPKVKNMWGDRVVFSGIPGSEEGLTLTFTSFDMNDHMTGDAYLEDVSLGVLGVNEDPEDYDYLIAIDQIELSAKDDIVKVSVGLIDYMSINSISESKRFTFLFGGEEENGDTIDFSKLSKAIEYDSNDFILKYPEFRESYLELLGLENFIATSKDDTVTLQNNTRGITLIGAEGRDKLITGDGDDVLYGGKQAEDKKSSIDDGEEDRLEGGDGYDRYYVNEKDVILDSDFKGRINLDGKDLSGIWIYDAESGKYQSETATGFTAELRDGNLYISDSGGEVTVEDWGDRSAGLDIILFKNETPETNGTSGNDALTVRSGRVNPGLGDDVVSAEGNGSMTLSYSKGDGNDIITNPGSSYVRDDTIQFKDLTASEVSLSRNNDQLKIKILETNETITINYQFWNNSTDYGINHIAFSDGEVWDRDRIKLEVETAINAIHGTDADEWLFGTDSRDEIWTGSGNDVVRGYMGSDIYHWGRGDGNDHFHDYNERSEDHDVLKLDGLNADDVVLVRQGTDLYIRINDTGETLRVEDQYRASGFGGVESVEFADGTIWNWDQITDNLSTHFVIDERYGHHSGDYLWIDGTKANDIISSGAGNAFMKGYTGDDIYIWGRGDGNDRLEEWGAADDHDILRLRDLNVSDIEIFRSDESLLIRINDTGENLTIVRQYAEGWFWDIEELEFADGTIWNQSDILNNLSSHFPVTGTDAGEWLFGTSGSDEIWTGAGNDVVRGHDGSDIYHWGRGDGNDHFHDYNERSEDHDVLKLDGLNADDVEFWREGKDLYVRIKNTHETLRVEDQFLASGFGGVESVEFADGTSWNWDQIKEKAEQYKNVVTGVDGQHWVDGTSASDIIRSGSDDNFMRGFAGSDIYLWGRGDGNDKLEDWGNWEDHDVIRLTNLNASDVDIVRSGEHLLIRVKDTGETLEVLGHFLEDRPWSIEEIEFADGTSWNKDEITNNLSTHFVIDERHGHHSGDYLWIDGTNANDIISSGAGNAFMKGYAGDDIYIWGRGDGNDRLEEWGTGDDHDILRLRNLNVSDIEVIRSDENLLIQIRDTGEYLTIVRQYTEGWFWDIEEIEFADGTIWNQSDIQNNLSSHLRVNGVDGQYWVDGTNGSDIIRSGSDDSFMRGFAGSDIYLWGQGNGNDRIEDWGNPEDHDVIRLTNLNASDIDMIQEGNHLLIRVKDTGETLEVLDHFREDRPWSIEEIEFADGTSLNKNQITENLSPYVIINGTGQDYFVDGTRWNDMIRSGSDDNFMRGFTGSDIYLWGRGDGNDKLEDWGNWEDHDVIRLTNLNASDIDLTRHENDLVVRIKDNGETLKVLGHFMEDRAWDIEAIEFADGTSWDSAQIRNVAETGISAANAVTGSSYALSADSDDTFLFNNELYHVSEDETVNAGLPQENIRASDYNQILESAPPAENYSVLPELPFAFSLHEDDFSFAA